MDHSQHNKIVSFIWSIADDCLRDVFVRGKYRDVILPMFVLRRLDCLLEPSKDAVLEEVRFQREDAKLADLDPAGLKEASGHVFYNTSRFTLKSLLGNPSQLEANVRNYLDGFSDNVKEIVEKFDLRNQIAKMDRSDVLHDVIEKFVSEEINLSPADRKGPDGRNQPGLSNLGMGYVFEELIRKFNEENNEEAGEHFTPREVIKLMTNLVFIPVKDRLPNPLTIYDPACGSGGMLTESQDFVLDPEGEVRAKVGVFLYGKESQPETYAICKSDLMIKENDPGNIVFGSTLGTNSFAGKRFDFMLTNPPYGKSWKADQDSIVSGKEVIDPRFEVVLSDFRGENPRKEPAIPRSSDGQLLFLMEMVDKMKRVGKGGKDGGDSPLGSRIASVQNGSALFTGDAGSGESNIRRHLIENDWLEAIIQLPNNLFYNTGITTYVWLLSNHKPASRRGKVQLVDASNLYRKLRKNLGEKNCEFAEEHIHQITKLYLNMPNDGISKVFDNRDFGYYKVTVERPLRLAAQFTPERIGSLRYTPGMREVMEWAFGKYGDDVYDGLEAHAEAIELHLEREEIALSPRNRKDLLSAKTWQAQRALMQAAERLGKHIGGELHLDFNDFTAKVDEAIQTMALDLSAPGKKQILNAMSWRDERAKKVIRKHHKLAGAKLNEVLGELCTSADRLADYGYWPGAKPAEYIEYEPDSELRDTENVPLKEDIYDYFMREVRPHVDEAWIAIDKTVIGYEIGFNKHFYQHEPLRSLQEVTGEILALEAETEGLLKELVSFVGKAA